MHPTGLPVLDENARGGPELPLTIYATKAGFTRFFTQVQIGGPQVFAPFNVTVALQLAMANGEDGDGA